MALANNQGQHGTGTREEREHPDHARSPACQRSAGRQRGPASVAAYMARWRSGNWCDEAVSVNLEVQHGQPKRHRHESYYRSQYDSGSGSNSAVRSAICGPLIEGPGRRVKRNLARRHRRPTSREGIVGDCAGYGRAFQRRLHIQPGRSPLWRSGPAQFPEPVRQTRQSPDVCVREQRGLPVGLRE